MRNTYRVLKEMTRKEMSKPLLLHKMLTNHT